MWYTIIIITEGLGDNKTTCEVMIFLKKKKSIKNHQVFASLLFLEWQTTLNPRGIK